jgi:hypothetical protein
MKHLIIWLIIFIFAAFAWHWSKASLVEPKPAYYLEYSIADLNKDGIVNQIDLAIFSAEWMKEKKQFTYSDANNPQGLKVYYDPNMPASEFEKALR